MNRFYKLTHGTEIVSFYYFVKGECELENWTAKLLGTDLFNWENLRPTDSPRDRMQQLTLLLTGQKQISAQGYDFKLLFNSKSIEPVWLNM